jgi:hypothetical protein
MLVELWEDLKSLFVKKEQPNSVGEVKPEINYKIVQFKDNTYGLLRNPLFRDNEEPKFLDLKNHLHHWTIKDTYFKDCKGSLDDVKNLMQALEARAYQIIDDKDFKIIE